MAYIDTENERTEVTDRLRDQGRVLQLNEQQQELLGDNWIYVDTQEEGPLQFLRLDGSGFKKLTKFVTDHKIEVLVIDNFGRVFPGKETEEDKVKIFYAALQRLKKDCPSLQDGFLLILHHVTKPHDGFMPDLISNPYEWLSRVRGSGRILDFCQVRLGLDEQDIAGDKYYVVNGLVRSGQVTPLLLERMEGGKAFQIHQDKDLVVKRVFACAPRRMELFNLLPTEKFTFSDCERLTPGGKRFCKNTISDTLDVAVRNGLVVKHPDGSYSRLESLYEDSRK